MKKNLYNSKDKEHQHIAKLLKELPKEKAPDNFEYNLSVKIKNKNFGLNTKESFVFAPWKVLMPAAGVVAASVLLFFIVFSESDSFENPFHIKPQLRQELSSSISSSVKTFSDFGKKNKINENDVVIKGEPEKMQQAEKMVPPIVNEEIIAEAPQGKPDYPFGKSTNLDEVLNKKQNSLDLSKRASLAGRSNSRSLFNGFFIREEVDKEYVEALKARNDSLNNALKSSKKN